MSILLSLILVVAAHAADPLPAGCHPQAAEAGTFDANQLNTAGYRCYKEKKYAEAASLFGAAAAADDDLALAHYNLACTLALLRREHKVCDNDAYLERILEHLERAIALDAGRRERMQSDSDLDELHTTVRYHQLVGIDTSTAEGLAKVLPHLRFYSPAEGVWGNMTQLQMLPKGSISARTLQFDDEMMPLGFATSTWTWSLEGTTIVVGDSKGTKSRYALTEEGSLNPLEGGPGYHNLPDDCSA